MKKRKILYLNFAVIILLSLSLPLAIDAYVNQEYGFMINPPAGWEKGVNPYVLAEFNAPSPYAGASIIVDFEEGVQGTLDNWPEPSGVAAYLSSRYDNYDLLFEYKRNVISGAEGYEFVYTVFESGVEMKFQQEMYVVNGKTISITCRSLASNFGKLQDTFDRCVETFWVDPTLSTPTPTPVSSFGSTTFPIEIVYAAVAVISILIIAITLIQLKKTSK